MYKPAVITIVLVLMGYSIMTLDQNEADNELLPEKIQMDQQRVTIDPTSSINKTPETESVAAPVYPSPPVPTYPEARAPEESTAWEDPCAAFKTRRTCVLMSNHDTVRRTCIWRQRFFQNSNTRRIYEEESCVALY
jgi:hypothetical protein